MKGGDITAAKLLLGKIMIALCAVNVLSFETIREGRTAREMPRTGASAES